MFRRSSARRGQQTCSDISEQMSLERRRQDIRYGDGLITGMAEVYTIYCGDRNSLTKLDNCACKSSVKSI